MFEVSSLRSNTSSKSFAPLINSHVDSRLFKAAPHVCATIYAIRTKLQSAYASVRRWCGFSSGIHDAA